MLEVTIPTYTYPTTLDNPLKNTGLNVGTSQSGGSSVNWSDVLGSVSQISNAVFGFLSEKSKADAVKAAGLTSDGAATGGLLKPVLIVGGVILVSVLLFRK